MVDSHTIAATASPALIVPGDIMPIHHNRFLRQYPSNSLGSFTMMLKAAMLGDRFTIESEEPPC